MARRPGSFLRKRSAPEELTIVLLQLRRFKPDLQRLIRIPAKRPFCNFPSNLKKGAAGKPVVNHRPLGSVVETSGHENREARKKTSVPDRRIIRRRQQRSLSCRICGSRKQCGVGGDRVRWQRVPRR